MPLTARFEDHELMELRMTLDRAMNTWEPKYQPKWLQPLSDAVDKRLRALEAQESGDTTATYVLEGAVTPSGVT